MPKKYTNSEYRELFNNLYPNYELLSEYNGDKNYIIVKCKLDNYIWRTKPNWLKQGAGCQECYNKRRSETLKIKQEDFIKRAQEVHGNKYSYSKVNYINSRTKITVVCPIHGDFLTIPSKHINNKNGCPKCANEQNGITKKLSKETFINKCNKIHNNKYDYSKVNYTGWNNSITIICPKHGEFAQIAGTHLSGCGCPKCKESQLEKVISNFLKQNNINYISQYRSRWLGRQSIDFYLPNHNIAIECQGSQHYDEKNIKWNKYDFKNIIKLDKLKLNKCINNNVNLIYYTNDDSILSSKLFYNDKNTATNLKKLLNLIKK